jgi:hypothetical protein
MNKRVRSKASRTVADSVCRHGGAALNVNHDDLAVGGDQYRHDYTLRMIVARWEQGNELNAQASATGIPPSLLSPAPGPNDRSWPPADLQTGPFIAL